MRRNHWWNVPFHLTGRGITTRPMGQVHGHPIFPIDFDFIDHELRIHTMDGRAVAVPASRSPPSTTRPSKPWPSSGSRWPSPTPPYDLPDAHRPFADDTEHASYDPAWAAATGRSSARSTWSWRSSRPGSRAGQPGAPLLAHLRHRPHPLLDRHVDQPLAADPVTREAYSREVISFGFWFGDDRFAEPAFYAYTAPEPAGLADQPLQPAAAWWDPRDGSHLAVLGYDDARATTTPASVLGFYERLPGRRPARRLGHPAPGLGRNHRPTAASAPTSAWE